VVSGSEIEEDDDQESQGDHANETLSAKMREETNNAQISARNTQDKQDDSVVESKTIDNLAEVENLIMNATKVHSDEEIESMNQKQQSNNNSPRQLLATSIMQFPPPVEVTPNHVRRALFNQSLPDFQEQHKKASSLSRKKDPSVKSIR